MADVQLQNVSVTGKKIPVSTTDIPNPMHQFASWTYSWSLWWLDINDHNALMNKPDVDTAMTWEPGSNSYVIAEDGGRYTDRRWPGARPLNYNIQNVDFETVVGPNSTTRHTNLVDGNVTILEPYGVTLIDLLINMSKNNSTGKFQAYTQQPFMLQCDFVGYDDDGNPVPNNLSVYRKRFPIKILSMDVEVGKGGSTYTCNFCATGAVGHYPELATTPTTIAITAGTVEEFFNGGTTSSDGYSIIPGMGLAYQLNQFYRNELQKPNSTVGAAEFVDQYRFIIDPAIANSKIVDTTQINLLNSAPGSKIDQTKNTFKIPAKSAIVDIVTRIMSQSSYFIQLQNINVNSSGQTGTGTDILNLFKTTLSTKYAGANKNGEITENVFDTKRQYYPLLLTYNIGQYTSYDGKHPATNSQVVNMDSFVIKRYSYLYTGQNLDILDFKLNFNSTYYTAVMAYQTPVAATKPSQATAADAAATAQPALGFNIMLFNDFPNLTPPRTRGVKVAQSVTAGGVIERPDAIVVSDVLKSVYTDLSGGDQVALDLTIVGDPTLLKQDDWLYVPNPVGSSVYNSWDQQGQDAFTAQYGHVRMDSGELVVYITVNSPFDIDDGSNDYPNQGLMFPQMDGTNTYTSLFSGYYKIISIKNTFQGGKFEQVLSLVRYTQSDYLRRVIPVQRIAGYNLNPPGAVSQSQVNQTNTNSTNGYTRY